jgi:hypothetical protein
MWLVFLRYLFQPFNEVSLYRPPPPLSILPHFMILLSHWRAASSVVAPASPEAHSYVCPSCSLCLYA